MKEVFIIFIICFSCQHVVCQNTWQKDSIMYMAAYKYITNDSINKNKLIVVSDSIEDLDRYWDTGLEQFPEESEKLKKQRNEQRKRYSIKTTYYSPLLASLFQNQDVKRSQTILFFSKIEDMILIANINFFNKRYIPEDNKFECGNYIWGISYEYLFIFNEDGTIKKALWRELMLN